MAKAFRHQLCRRLQSFNAFCLPGELFQHAATGAACAYNSITVLLGIFVYLQFDIFASTHTHTHTHRVAHLHTHTVAKKRCPRCLNKGRAALSCIRSLSLSISLPLCCSLSLAHLATAAAAAASLEFPFSIWLFVSISQQTLVARWSVRSRLLRCAQRHKPKRKTQKEKQKK